MGATTAALAQLTTVAMLADVRGVVEWSPAGSLQFQAASADTMVQAGDRVRTAPNGSARLLFTGGSSTELGSGTGVLVERLERGPNGNVVAGLVQSAGTTVNQVVPLVDLASLSLAEPAAGPLGRTEPLVDLATVLGIETPAAEIVVDATTATVAVAADGTTRVVNALGGPGGSVAVRGKDVGQTRVILQPGQETRVAPGLAPMTPASTISTPGGGLETTLDLSRQTERQERQQQQQILAQQQVAQAQLGLVAARAEANRLAQQEARLVQQIAGLLGLPNGPPGPKGAAPLNDTFATALPVSALPAQLTANTSIATEEAGEPNRCGTAPTGHTLWYALSLPATTPVIADTTGSSFDTVLAVYTGSGVRALSLVDCNDDAGGLQSRVVFTASAGTTYYLQVGGFAGAGGSLVLNLDAALLPPNDLFSAATPASVGSQFTVNTAAATTEPGEPTSFSCNGFPITIGATVWYALTPSASGSVTVDTIGSSFDTVVRVYSGTVLTALTPMDCNDNFGGTTQSSSTFPASAGTMYHIQVGGFRGAAGSLVVRFTPGPPLPPNDQFANAAPVTLSSLGAPPVSLNADTRAATTEAAEPLAFPCDGVSITVGKTVWYALTVSTEGTAVVDTIGSSFNTVLAVYTGGSLSSLTRVTCNDNAANGLQSQVGFSAIPGTTYYVQAAGFSGGGGNLGASGSLVVNFSLPPVPPNDAFGNAKRITSLPAQDTLNTKAATTELGEPTSIPCFGPNEPIGNTVWYAFTANTTMPVIVDTFGSDFGSQNPNTVLAVYTGSAVGSLTQVNCNVITREPSTDIVNSRIAFTAVAGTTYHVQVGGYNGRFGSLVVHFTAGPPPPANDNFSNAKPIITLPGQDQADTTSARLEAGETLRIPCQGLADIGGTVWYTFTPPANATVTVDTLGSNFDTVVSVYTGSTIAALRPIACNDDATGTRQSSVAFDATAGTTYHVQAGGFDGAWGSLIVHFSVTPPPSNDNLANAAVVPPLASMPRFATATLNATVEPGEPLTCGTASFGRTVWYAFTPTTATGTMTVSTARSDFDTVVAVYTRSGGGGLTQVGCNDDFSQPRSASLVTVQALAGTTYYIQVGGVGGVGGNAVVTFGGTAADVRAAASPRAPARSGPPVDHPATADPAKAPAAAEPRPPAPRPGR